MKHFGKIFLYALGGIAFLYFSVIGIGYFNSKLHVQEASVSLDTPIEKVWSKISSIEKYPEWISHVKKIEPHESAGVWTVTTANDEKLYFQSYSEPKKMFGFEMRSYNYHFRLTYFLSSEKGKTTLTVKQEEKGRHLFDVGLLTIRGRKYDFNLPELIISSLKKTLK